MTDYEIMEFIWRFLRGDLQTEDFVQWVYSEERLESLLGEKLHLELVSADYFDANSVNRIKLLLREHIRRLCPQDCMCPALSDLSRVSIGYEEPMLRTFRMILRRGEPYRWLSVHQCGACSQWWLVALEESFYDDIYLGSSDKCVLREV